LTQLEIIELQTHAAGWLAHEQLRERCVAYNAEELYGSADWDDYLIVGVIQDVITDFDHRATESRKRCDVHGECIRIRRQVNFDSGAVAPNALKQ